MQTARLHDVSELWSIAVDGAFDTATENERTDCRYQVACLLEAGQNVQYEERDSFDFHWSVAVCR